MIERLESRRLLAPEDVAPSRDDFKVIGTFNPGAVRHGDGVTLLVRVTETLAAEPGDRLGFPRWEFDGARPELVVEWIDREELDLTDPREVRNKVDGLIRLPFVSHLRRATSRDGLTLDWIDPAPSVVPAGPMESGGLEDPRITPLPDGEGFAVACATPSSHGVGSTLMTTHDFESWRRIGVAFPTENKDVALLPERVGGRYVALHRPNGHMRICPPEMWVAFSPDLVHWGEHHVVDLGRGPWTERVGAGPPPIRTPGGWLLLYHGVDRPDRSDPVGHYGAMAALLDADEPWRVLARSREPILKATEPWETEGFVPNILFPTGMVADGDRLIVYCGAADRAASAVVVRLDDVLGTLEPV